MGGSEQAELEAALGHRFQQPEWLERALTHSSRLPELSGGTSKDGARRDHRHNENLEFLGDAVLGMIVSEYLVNMFPDWSEGQLSKSRAKLVNTASLHAAARRLRLGQYLRLGRGEEKTGGREKPAVLADAYEAVIASIYVDAGLEAARAFVRRSLLDEAVAQHAHRLGLADHKSALQELLQGRGLARAVYRVVSEDGPPHRKTFLVEVSVAGKALARASGANKKEAEQNVACLAMDQLLGKPE